MDRAAGIRTAAQGWAEAGDSLWVRAELRTVGHGNLQSIICGPLPRSHPKGSVGQVDTRCGRVGGGLEERVSRDARGQEPVCAGGGRTHQRRGDRAWSRRATEPKMRPREASVGLASSRTVWPVELRPGSGLSGCLFGGSMLPPCTGQRHQATAHPPPPSSQLPLGPWLGGLGWERETRGHPWGPQPLLSKQKSSLVL